MATLGAMKSRIGAELRRGDLAARAGDAITSAILFYERQRFRFNEGRSSSVAIAGQAIYQPPTDVVLIDRLTVTANGTASEVTQRPWDWIADATATGNTTGIPTDYCLYSGELHLYPIPDAAYPLGLSYVARLSALASDGDSNAWTTDAEELIRTASKKRIYAHFLREPDMAAAMQALENEALSALRGESTAQIGTGRVTPTCF